MSSQQLYVPTLEACEFGFNVLQESIDRFIRSRDVEHHKGVCVVVLVSPRHPISLDEDLIFQGITPGLSAIPQHLWAYPFMEIAIGKARASLQNWDTTANLIKKNPDYVPEFCRYPGGVYGGVKDETVPFSVGVSGAKPIYDEVFGWWMIDVLHGIALEPREVG